MLVTLTYVTGGREHARGNILAMVRIVRLRVRMDINGPVRLLVIRVS